MSPSRRDDIRAQIVESTGIDEAMIERLVHTFYDHIRDDAVLGPIFAERISDWGPHLQTMCDFWSSVALMTGRFHGNPMEKHARLPIDARHFDRWLKLFEGTARTICPPEAASFFIERAHRIAKSLELGIAMAHGKILGTGQRFIRDDVSVDYDRPTTKEAPHEQSKR